jgi:hypothetical protein
MHTHSHFYDAALYKQAQRATEENHMKGFTELTQAETQEVKGGAVLTSFYAQFLGWIENIVPIVATLFNGISGLFGLF